jgi:hypothetical protein
LQLHCLPPRGRPAAAVAVIWSIVRIDTQRAHLDRQRADLPGAKIKRTVQRVKVAGLVGGDRFRRNLEQPATQTEVRAMRGAAHQLLLHGCIFNPRSFTPADQTAQASRSAARSGCALICPSALWVASPSRSTRSRACRARWCASRMVRSTRYPATPLDAVFRQDVPSYRLLHLVEMCWQFGRLHLSLLRRTLALRRSPSQWSFKDRRQPHTARFRVCPVLL